MPTKTSAEFQLLNLLCCEPMLSWVTAAASRSNSASANASIEKRRLLKPHALQRWLLRAAVSEYLLAD